VKAPPNRDQGKLSKDEHDTQGPNADIVILRPMDELLRQATTQRRPKKGHWNPGYGQTT